MSWPKLWRALKSNSIVRALGVSVLLHLILFIVIESGNAKGLWKAHILPKTASLKATDLQKLLEQQQKQQNEQPVLHFVEVDPLQAVEAPKDTPYYSTANTQAGNPNPADANKPKIDGSQQNLLKTRDLVKADQKPAQPKQPLAPKKEPVEMQPATKPVAAAEPPGDTKQNTLTPDEKARRDMTFDRPTPPVKPRTLADARAQKGIIESPKMRQDGGVKKFAIETDLDVKASPFGSYDAAFIAAVQARWFALLEQRDFVFDRSGRVVIEFRLYKDGTVRQLNVAQNEVTETLSWCCQRAITDPAPYAPFPNDLKRLLKQDFRDVRFTFHYN